MNILVVDDSKTMLRIITNTLKRLGYEADTAEDGAIAFEKFKAKEYDVVMTDVNTI